MALDDLMKCMAKGMKLGFLTLMFSILVIALAHENGKADAAVYADGSVEFDEPTHEPGAMDQEWTEWSAQLWCGLLGHEIPMVRLKVHQLILARPNAGSTSTRCVDPLPEPSSFRLDALLADPENPAVVAYVYRLECARRQPAAWCLEYDLRKRLVELDSDNAYPHLLYLEGGSQTASDKSRQIPFSGSELEHLFRAASSSRMSSYWAHGTPEAYAAIEEKVRELPPIQWSEQAGVEMGEMGLSEGISVVDVASLELLASEWTFSPLSDITSRCGTSLSVGDVPAIEGCRRLGQLAADHGETFIEQSLGRAVLRLVERQDDATSDSRWERRIRSIVHYCKVPRDQGLGTRLPGPMPEGEGLLYLQDMVDYGEVIAAARKQAREYEIYPEAYPLDPSRCDDISTLPEHQKKALAEFDTELEGIAPQDAVLKKAAEFLAEK